MVEGQDRPPPDPAQREEEGSGAGGADPCQRHSCPVSTSAEQSCGFLFLASLGPLLPSPSLPAPLAPPAPEPQPLCPALMDDP